ncbi:hypothetical protein GGR28_003103 [Lewinella aquimaris]|uniref:Uncharacterized protein n=1 Tax=Neolewinella aquimaris TaxID=1835722 RepID=A0A840EF91_9BACT|nr:hypothetical protein [Neolewinella aquimaris]MBB4080469.1 hypothetical protein [Neolewinella aquimaris]
MENDKLRNFIQNHREEFDVDAPPTGLWNRVAAAIRQEDSAVDPLEGFVATHRDAFDNATPPPQLFERIVDTTTKEPRKLMAVTGGGLRIIRYFSAIAACLLLMFFAYNFGNRAGYQAGQEERIAQQLEKMDPELAEAERFYRQRINNEFVKVSQVNDDPQLRRDLNQLDETTAQIRAELLEVPVSQRPMLVNKLIETYRTKLDILLRIQQHFPNPNSPDGGYTPRPTQSTHES